MPHVLTGPAEAAEAHASSQQALAAPHVAGHHLHLSHPHGLHVEHLQLHRLLHIGLQQCLQRVILLVLQGKGGAWLSLRPPPTPRPETPPPIPPTPRPEPWTGQGLRGIGAWYEGKLKQSVAGPCFTGWVWACSHHGHHSHHPAPGSTSTTQFRHTKLWSPSLPENKQSKHILRPHMP